MSLADSTTSCPAMHSNLSFTTSSDGDTKPNFAQTKEPFDTTSYSELDDSEDEIEIEIMKSNPSDPTNNNFQIQIPEPTSPRTSPHTSSSSSEFSEPTTDDLIQYASEISLSQYLLLSIHIDIKNLSLLNQNKK